MRGYFGSSVCGFRPTGRLHLGHYFSVIKPGLDGATVLIANYHAPEEKFAIENERLLRSFGIQNIISQKDVFNAELFFCLTTLCSAAELERMPQFKSSEEKTAQLLTYPILMTHDIMGYKKVHVGEDQMAHIMFAHKLIKRYNRQFGGTVALPEGNVCSEKILDLRKSDRKMSKSFTEGCLFLDDTKDQISTKIQKAVTDPRGVENLRVLYKEFVGGDMSDSYGHAKKILTESIINKLHG